jgi:hypothetical protein
MLSSKQFIERMQAKELVNLRSTCKSNREALSRNMVWRILYRRDFGNVRISKKKGARRKMRDKSMMMVYAMTQSKYIRYGKSCIFLKLTDLLTGFSYRVAVRFFFVFIHTKKNFIHTHTYTHRMRT